MFEKCVIESCILIIFCYMYSNAETIMTSAPNPDVNIAVNKPTSSLGGASGNGNDGNTATAWGSNSCFYSNTADNMGVWWQVDLEDEFLLTKVKVSSRSDCCLDRLKDFSLDVYDTDQRLDPSTPARHCNFHTGAVSTPGLTVTVECLQPVRGRFLRITQMGGHLQFCELQAFQQLQGPFEPCGRFIQNKGKRSSSSLVTTQGPEVTSRAECAAQCGRDVTCTGFNFQDQPVVTCQLVHAPNGGSQVSDAAWDFYILNGCWRQCS